MNYGEESKSIALDYPVYNFKMPILWVFLSFSHFGGNHVLEKSSLLCQRFFSWDQARDIHPSMHPQF